MAGIKQVIQGLLTQLGAMSVLDADQNTLPIYARVWNNQIADLEDGKTYVWSRPAAFIELPNPQKYKPIGNMMSEADLIIRLHLAHDFYDAADEQSMEQDLVIFDLRDQAIALLNGYQLPGCSHLVKVAEEQDYKHKNLYHYIIDFTCAFVDSKGSPYDTGANKYRDSVPPQGLQTQITKSVGNDEDVVNLKFKIRSNGQNN